jgi:hypothetical protein
MNLVLFSSRPAASQRMTVFSSIPANAAAALVGNPCSICSKNFGERSSKRLGLPILPGIK